ncbi:MAG: hypothetical protein P4L79_07820 [Legionella sp.]|uniref:hypothetical protein n=1 Tax=Legionella sp. TaxID=459 RepID=UPI002851F26F|nr:hypothetical protein [Legionella sp.]
MGQKQPVSNKTAGNLADYGSGIESFQNRNEIIPSPEKMRQELLAVLGYKKDYPDTDFSPLEIGQTNSQETVVSNITKEVLKGEYPTAQAILFREDLIMTPQLEEVALRLNRLIQVDVREGTTDFLEFADAKKIVKENENELANFYKRGGKDEALLVLENVAESVAGTREMGQGELLEARDMVQAAIRAEFKNNNEESLPPHKLAGQEEGSKFFNRSGNPKLVEYLRLFDSLTLELQRQREIASDKENRLVLERQVTLNFLSGLPNLPGVDFNESLRKEFLKKIAVMNLNQLVYFDKKIELLELAMQDGTANKDEANKEIQKWRSRDFTPAELHNEIKEMKIQNDSERAEQLEVLRGNIRNMPVRNPIDKPVSPAEYFKKAA